MEPKETIRTKARVRNIKQGEPSPMNDHLERRLVYAVDMDGVICKQMKPGIWTTDDMMTSIPIQENIDWVNKKYHEGHIIIIHTARHISHQAQTEAWLQAHGVRYTGVRCGKVWADFYVDEKRKLLAIEEEIE